MVLEHVLEHGRELRRRIRLEFRIELPLLIARWKQVLFGGLFQYFHGMATQLAHRMHQPQEEPLGDIGFKYLPELGLQNAWISETIFWCLFIPFILWSFSPFVTARKRFYTAVIYARILVVLSLCQFLRILSFTVTQLPAPNYHCRAGEETAVLDMPKHWWGHIAVNVGRQATHGCGDLIFSSHTTFVLVGVLTFTEYGQKLLLKIIAWCGVAVMSLCIVASRKHYSVDVVVAWYTVPLVFYAMHRRWTTVRPVQDYWPHRPIIGEDLGVVVKEEDINDAMPLLPVVTVPSQHSRQSSKSDVSRPLQGNKLTGKDKEPISPPPVNKSPEESHSLNKAAMNGLGTRTQRRISGGLSSLSLRELEMREMENGMHVERSQDSGSPGNGTTQKGGGGCSIV